MTTTPTEPAAAAGDELHPDGAEQSEAAAKQRLADKRRKRREAKSSTPPKRRSRKTAAAKPAGPGTGPKADTGRVSGRQAILKVMADGKPAKAGDITAQAVKLIRPKPEGKTPEATLSALLYTQAKKADGIVVRTKNPGEFKLSSLYTPTTT